VTTGSWAALPAGADVAIHAGSTYAIVASVSQSTSRSQIDAAIAKYFPGAAMLSYVEQGQAGGPPPDPDTGRKMIGAVVSAGTFTGTLSWTKGIFLVAPDIYTLSGAWLLEPAGATLPLGQPWPGGSAPPPIARPPLNLWGVAFWAGVAVATGAAVYHWRQDFARAIQGRARA